MSMKRGLLTLFTATTLLLGGCLDSGGFTYSGDPVDPRCFLYGQESGTVALQACTGDTVRNKDYPVAGPVEIDAERGIGYTFTCEAEEGQVCDAGLSFYKVLGQMDNDFFVKFDNSGGGTGRFSQIRRVRLDNGVLRTEEIIAGGDRCNGGIAKAEMKGNSLSYSQFLTPFDLVELSGGNAQAKFEAYDDIQACAVCCVAEANYTNGELQTVTLTQDPAESPKDLDNKNQCFFTSYGESYKQMGVSLDAIKLRDLGQKFSDRCASLSTH